MSVQVLLHASRLYTGAGVRQKDGRRVQDQDLGIIEDGAIVFEPGKKILWVGTTAEFKKNAARKFARAKKTNLKNLKAVVPGFIDCHTHTVFSGSRSEEFSKRAAGASYEEIAASGGGILTTVRATREASAQELLKLASVRVSEMWDLGVRTLEIKSGYGLTSESEMRCLDVIKQLAKKFPLMTFRSTYLGAHAFPPKEEKSRADYLLEILNDTLPSIAKKKLAHDCDVFVDRGYYTLEEGKKILEKASSLGLGLKVHADELANTEATQLAVELGARSADHLLKISDKSLQAIARSQTVAVLLPITALFLKTDYAPARKLIDAGACVAVSTDFNPGSSPCPSLPVAMTLSALYMGMSRSEIFAAVTYNAAKALGLEKKKGTLEVGQDADVVTLPFDRFEEVFYRFASHFSTC